MIYPAPTLRRPSYAIWDHTIIKSVCAGHDFPIHDAEGVSLWFSQANGCLLTELPRIHLPRTSVNKGKKEGRVRLDWSDAAGSGLWLLED